MFQVDSQNELFDRRPPRVAACGRAAIHVLLVEFAAWRPRLSSLSACLDHEQRRRVAGLRDPAHRRDRQLAYALHRVALGQFLGVAPTCVPLVRTALGQPRLENGQAHTSLSHASSHAAIAISAAGPVGIDIEPRRRAFPLSPLADRICHADERGLSRDEDLLRLWVRKEALLKAMGVGLGLEMASFAAPEDGLVSLRPDPSAPAMTLRVRHVDAGAGCIAAVAGPPGASIECRWLLPDADDRLSLARSGREVGAALPMDSSPH